MNTSAIQTTGLRKSFGRTRALDGLDLSVATGEVHGFLGPNGAGKTTTLRILLGLVRADSGQAQLLGGDPWRDAIALHRRLAYVPGDVTLWPDLSGGEVIDLLGRLRGGIDPSSRNRLIQRFDLDPTRKSRAYSNGNRQKVALIAALASDAEPVLAGAVSRARWMSSHVLVAALGPVAILGVLGLAAGLTYGSSVGDISHQVPRVLSAALAYLPAVWVMAGIAAAQYGLVPRLSFLSWSAWLVFAVIDFAHERQLVSQSVSDISPFAHVPKVLLGEPLVVAPLVVLVGVAAALVTAGLAGFARRDVG